MTKQYPTLIPLFDELRGERVLLRPYREDDAQALFEAVGESRDHLRPWESFADEHQSVEESRDFIIQCMAQWLTRKYLGVGIWEATTGRYLGGTGLNPHDWELGYFEIGYWIRATETGHGYVTEAVKLLTDYAFTQLPGALRFVATSATCGAQPWRTAWASYRRRGCATTSSPISV